jgi:raffinose/stachyose/melibiose transport system permease protein
MGRVTGVVGGRPVSTGPTTGDLTDAPATRRPPASARSGSWWWALPAVALVLAIHYLAIGAGGVLAFTNSRGIGPFEFVGAENFLTALADAKARTALGNTLLMAAAYLVLTTITGLSFALALNRQLKSRNILRVVLFAPVVVSPLAVAYIWKFIYEPTGPINEWLGALGLESLQRTWLGDPTTAIPAIILVMVWQNTGLTMVIYLAGLANIPAEVEEAAAIDGSSVWQRFRHITWPLLRPTFAISTTLLLISGLRVFDQVIALTNGGPFGASETLATVVYKESFVRGNYGYGAALSVVLTLLILVLAIVQNTAVRRTEA